MDEKQLKRLIRTALPADAHKPKPTRIIGGLLVLLSVILTSLYLAISQPHWLIAVCISVGLGNLYVMLKFYGHEMAHGSILQPGIIRSAFQYCTETIYVISPHLWKYWHNHTHHLHTNVPERDPDYFPPMMVEEMRDGPFAWIARRIVPGSGHWLSLINLFIQFTLQGQVVLWRDSRRWRFTGMNRRRAIIDSAGMVLFWLILALWLGAYAALLVILIPMLSANFIIMAYVHTNHLLRPPADTPRVLDSSMSVRTCEFLDFIHLHFSHHVEHHLFPNLSHQYYPEVRKLLVRHAAERYLAPNHWRALRVLYSTPRVYCPSRGFVNPIDGTTLSLSSLEAQLRDGGK